MTMTGLDHPSAVAAHDLPALLDNATVDARVAAGLETMATPKPSVADLYEAVDFIIDYEIGSMKAALRCGGKLMRSRLRRVACLQALQQKLTEALAKEQG